MHRLQAGLVSSHLIRRFLEEESHGSAWNQYSKQREKRTSSTLACHAPCSNFGSEGPPPSHSNHRLTIHVSSLTLWSNIQRWPGSLAGESNNRFTVLEPMPIDMQWEGRWNMKILELMADDWDPWYRKISDQCYFWTSGRLISARTSCKERI